MIEEIQPFWGKAFEQRDELPLIQTSSPHPVMIIRYYVLILQRYLYFSSTFAPPVADFVPQSLDSTLPCKVVAQRIY